MDAIHLHLLINHVPVLATFFSLALLAWAMVSKHPEHYKISFLGFVVAGLFVVITFQSGEGAEDLVESLAGISESALENHEHAAPFALWMTLLLGIGGFIGLFLNKRGWRGFHLYVWGLFVLGVLTAIALAYVAYLGGLIRHTEIALVQQVLDGAFLV